MQLLTFTRFAPEISESVTSIPAPPSSPRHHISSQSPWNSSHSLGKDRHESSSAHGLPTMPAAELPIHVCSVDAHSSPHQMPLIRPMIMPRMLLIHHFFVMPKCHLFIIRHHYMTVSAWPSLPSSPGHYSCIRSSNSFSVCLSLAGHLGPSPFNTSTVF